jgi:SAM-dependent methyltransferase
MDTSVRRPFQGVTNIVKFNWHFYLSALACMLFLLAITTMLPDRLTSIVQTIAILVPLPVLISLGVSYYVYDYSGLYDFKWLTTLPIGPGARIVNINAGFDETSALLRQRYSLVDLTVFDFYDAEKHTEISIERARRAYKPYPDTQKITTGHIPVEHGSVDVIFNFFSLHEIRNRHERIGFLAQQYIALKPGGRCVVVEHLRDATNFIAYTIGFLHFFSRQEWHSNFISAGFHTEQVMKVTPFVSVLVLAKTHGDTP